MLDSFNSLQALNTKIGIHYASSDYKSYKYARMLDFAFKRLGFATVLSLAADDFVQENADLIISTSMSNAKTTNILTYGIIAKKASDWLKDELYVRNALTWDSYIVSSEEQTKIIKDLVFGARKTGCKYFDMATITSSSALPRGIGGLGERVFAVTDSDTDPKIIELYKHISKKIKLEILKLDTDSFTDFDGSSVPLKNFRTWDWDHNKQEPVKLFNTRGIGIFLDVSDSVDQNINLDFITCVAEGNLCFVNYEDQIYEVFGNTLVYIPKNPSPNFDLVKFLDLEIKYYQQNVQISQEKILKAQKIVHTNYSVQSRIKKFLPHHEEVKIAKGYVNSNWNEKSVSFIIRTGGNRGSDLVRAIDSLKKQSHKNIQVILVLFDELNILDEIKALCAGALRLKIVNDMGGLRGDAIAVGISHVDTDYFGLLDDDDLVNPNHVDSLLTALNKHNKADHRGEILLAYSGAYFFSDQIYQKEMEVWQRGAGAHSASSLRVVEHFRLYDSKKMAKHLWYMMSNSWLASSKLIDYELLEPPGTHSCEDLYFELLMATKTHFAFSAEMTAGHNIHNSNSTFVDSRRHQRDTIRHGLRLLSRTLHGGEMYRSPFAVSWENEHPREIHAWDYNVRNEFEYRFEDKEETILDVNPDPSSQESNPHLNMLLSGRNDLSWTQRGLKSLLILLNAKKNSHLVKVGLSYLRAHGLKEFLRKVMEYIRRH